MKAGGEEDGVRAVCMSGRLVFRWDLRHSPFLNYKPEPFLAIDFFGCPKVPRSREIQVSLPLRDERIARYRTFSRRAPLLYV